MKVTLLFVWSLAAALHAQDSRPAEAGGVLPQNWAKLGPEGKWMAYRKAMARGVRGTKSRWVEALVGRKDYQLLEWMVIYEGWIDQAQEAKPGHALHQAGAPQWIRAAVWCLKNRDGHTMQESLKALQQEPALVLGWIQKYPTAKRLGAKIFLRAVGGEGVYDPEPAGDALPPLDPMSVLLPFLDAPKKLQRFGDKLRARPSERFFHQVVRAVNGVVTAGQWQEPFRSKVLALTRHPDLPLRRHALLSFSRWPKPQVPFQELRKLVDKGEDRPQALLALSYSDHPAAYLLLCRFAKQPAHVCWQVAVSRLGDLDFRNDFGAGILMELPSDDLSATQRAFLATELAKVRRRGLRKQPVVKQLLERVAWARLDKLDVADGLWTFARGKIATVPAVTLRQQLMKLRSYRPTGSLTRDPQRRAVQAMVRKLAGEL